MKKPNPQNNTAVAIPTHREVSKMESYRSHDDSLIVVTKKKSLPRLWKNDDLGQLAVLLCKIINGTHFLHNLPLVN